MPARAGLLRAQAAGLGPATETTTHAAVPRTCAHPTPRAQPKRAGLRNGSGMDMFDWQLAKRDEQMKEAVELASQKGVKGEPWAYWKAFHEAEAAAHH